jgi:leucyl/phenylalanyl-tRNA--protein transferase
VRLACLSLDVRASQDVSHLRRKIAGNPVELVHHGAEHGNQVAFCPNWAASVSLTRYRSSIGPAAAAFFCDTAGVIPVELLLRAYATGWFPMAQDGVPGAPIEWFSPDPRGVLPLDEFRVSSRLVRIVRQGRFEVVVNRAFEGVMRACAARDETWISEEIVASYVALHARGFAHSVEAWQDGRLAGGLYGVSLGGAFFGESMFHHVTDASKVALVSLVGRLVSRGYALLDIQWVTPHLAQFGATSISRRRYLRMLERSQRLNCRFL